MGIPQKVVFVSGCFDLLHSGHIAFLNCAAKQGRLIVSLGSDATILDLKGRPAVTNERERLYMIESLECVSEAFISTGKGILDFSSDLERIKPDQFIVNADGDIPAKRKLCESLGIEYKVLIREPFENLPPRSTTNLRTRIEMPYRLDLAGGWLDQPFISKLHSGSVITVSLEPAFEFNERSGMASSTRRTAIELWGPRLPSDDPEKLSQILFCCENPPGSQYISGSQDAIGLVYPGIAKSNYDGNFWPEEITSTHDESIIKFIENHVFLKPLGPRTGGYDVMKDSCLTVSGAKALSLAAQDCWEVTSKKPATFRSCRFSLIRGSKVLIPQHVEPRN
jgi:cytidyltransferase-like protein